MAHYDDGSDDYIECDNCGDEFHVRKMTKCSECGEYYCRDCYEDHKCTDDED